jgi:Arc/MetJ-type ribon-helix-helix transcriptional regulator
VHALVNAMMKKWNVSITEEMEKRLEAERKKRALDSIPETIRYILADYLSKN